MDAQARFERLARAPEGAIRLAEAALWIAADEYPELDTAAWLRRLDALGRAAATAVPAAADVDRATTALGRLLFEAEGFRGNAKDYYDPRNSFLNDVLERRLGIPITLSVLYIDVAAGAGLTVRGIGLPGHFVVRAERHGRQRLVDPFNRGAALTEADCQALVQRVRGRSARLEPPHLRPVTTRAIVSRMLANLKGVYLARRDWARGLRTIDRALILTPGAPDELRDRGTVHSRLGNSLAAIRDWEAYLAALPEAADADQVRRALRQARAVLN
jgi:regulator of sirC expression with transglutaminase-like and TPR domain